MCGGSCHEWWLREQVPLTECTHAPEEAGPATPGAKGPLHQQRADVLSMLTLT